MAWTRIPFWIYLLILVGVDGTIFNWADPDLWHRLTLGEYLVQHHAFPAGGTFSYLADYPVVVDHEWGSALVFYGLYSAGGGPALVGLKLVSLALTLAFLVWAGLRNRAYSVLAAAFYAIVLLALLPSFASTLRSMIFTHFIFAVWLYWFQVERTGGRISSWAYPLSMIFWANLHGGFVIGLVWLGAIAIVDYPAWKKWLGRLAACLAATLINPYGWRLWTSIFHALAFPRQGFNEWAPVDWWPDLMAYPGYKLLLLPVVVGLAVLVGRRGWARIDRIPFALLAGAFVLSLTSGRNTSLFAEVAGALLPSLFPPPPRAVTIPDPAARLGFIALGQLCLIVPFFVALRALPGQGLRLVMEPSSCPVQAVSYLQSTGVTGRLLVPFNYGSYAMWELRGRMRVSMDGRYDLVYTASTYRQVNDFFSNRADGWTLTTSPAPDAILLPVQAQVFSRLSGDPLWHLAYRNATDAVFEPVNPAR